MTFFPNFATIVTIGNFSLRWYPVLLITGGLLIFWLSARNLKKAGYPSDLADDLFIGCTIGGIVGARLWYCAFYDLSAYLSNPLSILYTWEGGLAIQGAVFGGFLFAAYYCYKHHYSVLRICDAIFPNMLLAQACGRWGNFFNQEAFGRVVSAEFYNNWPSFIKEHMFIAGSYREPTFLYESMTNLLGFLLIVFVYKKFSKPKRGDMVYAYLMWYGVTRFVIEGLRSDSLMLGNLRMAQLTAIAGLLIGILGMLGVFRKLAPKPVVLFDFDQTLANTEPIIMETYRRLFAKYLPEYPFGEADRKKVLGPTLKEGFESYPFEQNTDDLIAEYRQINIELHESMVHPMPHALEMLQTLKKQGYRTGIVTNKFEEVLKLGLQVTHLEAYIDTLVGLDQVSEPKPDPQGIHKAVIALKGCYDNCVYVGDSYNDILAGRNACAFTIGINEDPVRAEEMSKAMPNVIINDLNEIPNILKEDHGWTSDLS